jgi:hypothetical protein
MGWSYLTIPISTEFRLSKIKDVMLPLHGNWQRLHWKSIYLNYAKANFFNPHIDFFEELYRKDFKYLADLNVEIILYLLKVFEINVKILRYSSMDVDPDLHKTDMIIALAKASGADVFISGEGTKTYADFEKFARNDVQYKFFNFQHPVYQQRYPGFLPNLSAIDLLFNMGPEASRIIETSGRIEDSIVPSTQSP